MRLGRRCRKRSAATFWKAMNSFLGTKLLAEYYCYNPALLHGGFQIVSYIGLPSNSLSMSDHPVSRKYQYSFYQYKTHCSFLATEQNIFFVRRQRDSLTMESLQALNTENGRRFLTPLVCAGRLLTG